jgi:hypothetical protein
VTINRLIDELVRSIVEAESTADGDASPSAGSFATDNHSSQHLSIETHKKDTNTTISQKVQIAAADSDVCIVVY